MVEAMAASAGVAGAAVAGVVRVKNRYRREHPISSRCTELTWSTQNGTDVRDTTTTCTGVWMGYMMVECLDTQQQHVPLFGWAAQWWNVWTHNNNMYRCLDGLHDGGMFDGNAFTIFIFQ